MQVFAEAPSSVREVVTGSAAGPDGSLWVTTESNVPYRYDRVLGWDRVAIAGWDPGRVVTRPSQALAIAVGADGSGVVVGEGGRIADIRGDTVSLDRAAATTETLCRARGGAPPCGTSRDLRSVAVAPDGSALIGGDNRSLLWRPAGGEFRLIDPPPSALTATFTAVSMPAADRAYVATTPGQVFAGRLEGERWSWRREDLTDDGEPVALTDGNTTLTIRAISVDPSGRGFAVGDKGLVLQRGGGALHPWRRVAVGFREDFQALATLPGDATRSAIIAGAGGIVLTLTGGRFLLARAPDGHDVLNGVTNPSAAVGATLAPGGHPGDVEAWVVEQSSRFKCGQPARFLHYSSDPDDSLLEAGRSVRRGSEDGRLTRRSITLSETKKYRKFTVQ